MKDGGRVDQCSQQELVQGVQRGDEEYCRRFVNQYQKLVYGLAKRLLSDDHEAQDATQDVFRKAFGAMGRFRNGCALSTYLVRITTNHCLDLLRQRNRIPDTEDDSVLAFVPSRNATGDPFTALVALELEEALEKALSELPPLYRETFKRNKLQGMPESQIAAAMRLSVSQVRSYCARARMKLQKSLNAFLAARRERPS